MNCAVPRPRAPGRPDDAEDTLGERLQEVLAELTVEHKKGDDHLVADGDYPSTAGIPNTSPRERNANEDFRRHCSWLHRLNRNSDPTCEPDVSKESVAECFFESASRIRPGRFCSSVIPFYHTLPPSSITLSNRFILLVLQFRHTLLGWIRLNQSERTLTANYHHKIQKTLRHPVTISALCTANTQS